MKTILCAHVCVRNRNFRFMIMYVGQTYRLFGGMVYESVIALHNIVELCLAGNVEQKLSCIVKYHMFVCMYVQYVSVYVCKHESLVYILEFIID